MDTRESRVKTFQGWSKVLSSSELNHILTELLYTLNDWNEYFKERVMDSLENVYLLIFTYKGLQKIKFDENTDAAYTSFYNETKTIALGGYILLYPKSDTFLYIDVCNTCIPNLNLLRYMIKKIESKRKKRILPFHIIPSSTRYWEKYLNQEYGLKTREEATEFSKHLDVNWASLFTNV
jgi:hypothetical protein